MAVVRQKSGKSRPRWKRRPRARPSEIAKAAIEVFAKAGFESATMEEIAARAGVSKGTIYLYYPSKEDLLVSAVEHRIRENQAMVLPLLNINARETDTVLTRDRVRGILTELVDRVIRVISSPETLMTLQVVMAERRRSARLRKRQTELVNIAYSAVVEFLTRSHHAKAIVCPEPKYAARVLMSLILSFPLLGEFLGKSGESMGSEKARRAVIDFTLRGLGLDEGGD